MPAPSSIEGKLQEKINTHAALEQHGSNVYMAAAFFFEQKNYKGIAKHLLKESEDERTHALEFYDYLHKRGGKAVAGAVAAVPEATMKKWNESKAFATTVLQTLLDIEYQVEKSIHDLLETAQAQKDHATAVFLQKFVELQVTEIDEMRSLVEKAQAYEALPGLLYHLDAELD